MDLLNIPENPTPSGAVSGTIKTADKVDIRFARWRPTARKHLGTVCVFTGRSEYIEKYYETVTDLRRRGFNVVVMDWRGQGGSQRLLSDPRKGHVDHFQEYERDVEALMRDVVLPDCPPPYFALAHSMGGCILLHLATRPSCWFERIMLSAPMVEIRNTGRPVRFITGLFEYFGMGNRYVPGGGATATDMSPFAGNPFTSDPARHERGNATIQARPELGLGSPTIGWLHAAFQATRPMQQPRFGYELRTPVLMVAAGNDKIVSTKAIEKLGLEMRAGRHLVIPGARHELLMEQDYIRELFWAAFDGFIPGEGPFR